MCFCTVATLLLAEEKEYVKKKASPFTLYVWLHIILATDDITKHNYCECS